MISYRQATLSKIDRLNFADKLLELKRHQWQRSIISSRDQHKTNYTVQQQPGDEKPSLNAFHVIHGY